MLPNGRRIGIDFGDARIGMAVSDASAILASPYETFRAEAALEAITEYLKEELVVAIYVGLPLHLSGSEGESAIKARNFAAQLRNLTPSSIAIRLMDERLSTKSAAARVLQSGGRVERTNIDQLAAVEILESALNAERTTGKWAGHEI